MRGRESPSRSCLFPAERLPRTLMVIWLSLFAFSCQSPSDSSRKCDRREDTVPCVIAHAVQEVRSAGPEPSTGAHIDCRNVGPFTYGNDTVLWRDSLNPPPSASGVALWSNHKWTGIMDGECHGSSHADTLPFRLPLYSFLFRRTGNTHKVILHSVDPCARALFSVNGDTRRLAVGDQFTVVDTVYDTVRRASLPGNPITEIDRHVQTTTLRNVGFRPIRLNY